MIENKLVNFMIIGVQKCGTTSLSSHITKHPQINFCKQKEPDFFSKNSNWHKQLKEYHSLFDCANPGCILGEASTTYSWLLEYPDTPNRLFKYNPDLRFVYIVRDPVERIRSHYMHHYLKARTKYGFLEEVLSDPTYINHSRYAIQIRQYIELFGKDSFYFLTLEDYKNNTEHHLENIFEFLGVSQKVAENIELTPKNLTNERLKESRLKSILSPVARYAPKNIRDMFRFLFFSKNKYNISMCMETRRLLWRYLEDDVLAFEKISSLDLNVWRTSNGIDRVNR
jgi:hypothetical protein